MDFYRVKGCVVCAVLIFGMYNNLNDFFFRIHNVYCVCLCLCMYWKWMNAVRVCWQCYNEKKTKFFDITCAPRIDILFPLCTIESDDIYGIKKTFFNFWPVRKLEYLEYVDVGVLIKSQSNINVEGNNN